MSNETYKGPIVTEPVMQQDDFDFEELDLQAEMHQEDVVGNQMMQGNQMVQGTKTIQMQQI